MNAETLKYYSHPKMQEKFREVMGEWQGGGTIMYLMGKNS